jgi:RNA polymerase sigma factor (sigma-70 family)
MTTKFNPDFWEVTISEESWEQFTLEDGLYYESPEEVEERLERAERAESLWPTISAIMDEVLTARQREVISLYFFEGLNQREIAEKLSISQQSVSEHLYGKNRNGRVVGGALRKLRKACVKRGVRWD